MPSVVETEYADAFCAASTSQQRNLKMSGHVCGGLFSKSEIVTDLDLVEQPVWIAVQDLGQMGADVAGRLAETVHDAAQRRFMDAQHPSQTVLADPGGVHPQLQIGVDVTIQRHGVDLASVAFSTLAGIRGLLVLQTTMQLRSQTQSACLQHIVVRKCIDDSQKVGKLPNYVADLSRGNLSIESSTVKT